MVVVTSVKAARRRLRYESWHLLHLYAYLGVGLALPHQLWTGQEFLHSPAATLYWWTLWAAAARPSWCGGSPAVVAQRAARAAGHLGGPGVLRRRVGLPHRPPLGVDALMDMCRTSVNVIGNCVATAVVARWEGVPLGRVGSELELAISEA